LNLCEIEIGLAIAFKFNFTSPNCWNVAGGITSQFNLRPLAILEVACRHSIMRWTAVPQKEGPVPSGAGKSERSGLFCRFSSVARILVATAIGSVVLIMFASLQNHSSGNQSTGAQTSAIDFGSDLEAASARVFDEKYGGEGPLRSAYIPSSIDTWSKQLQATCPAWSESFLSEFSNKCGFWFETFDRWMQKIAKSPKPPVGYLCY
jgi:hypothetical protein